MARAATRRWPRPGSAGRSCSSGRSATTTSGPGPARRSPSRASTCRSSQTLDGAATGVALILVDERRREPHLGRVGGERVARAGLDRPGLRPDRRPRRRRRARLPRAPDGDRPRGAPGRPRVGGADRLQPGTGRRDRPNGPLGGRRHQPEPGRAAHPGRDRRPPVRPGPASRVAPGADVARRGPDAARAVAPAGPGVGEAVVVTLGPAGALLVTAEAALDVPSIDVVAVDTTGAGDAFNGALAVGPRRGSLAPGRRPPGGRRRARSPRPGSARARGCRRPRSSRRRSPADGRTGSPGSGEPRSSRAQASAATQIVRARAAAVISSAPVVADPPGRPARAPGRRRRSRRPRTGTASSTRPRPRPDPAPATVTDSSPAPPGSPVRGSTRWWTVPARRSRRPVMDHAPTRSPPPLRRRRRSRSARGHRSGPRCATSQGPPCGDGPPATRSPPASRSAPPARSASRPARSSQRATPSAGRGPCRSHRGRPAGPSRRWRHAGSRTASQTSPAAGPSLDRSAGPAPATEIDPAVAEALQVGQDAGVEAPAGQPTRAIGRDEGPDQPPGRPGSAVPVPAARLTSVRSLESRKRDIACSAASNSSDTELARHARRQPARPAPTTVRRSGDPIARRSKRWLSGVVVAASTDRRSTGTVFPDAHVVAC